MTLLEQLQQQCSQVLNQLFPEQVAHLNNNELEISLATNNKFGHYQFNGAMKLSKTLKMPPRVIAEQIRDQLLAQQSAGTNIFSNIEVAGPGFINFTLSSDYLSDLVNKQLVDPRHGCALITDKKRVVIDFSSPNIAKEMHVGHLRSTIIGDCIARVLEFAGYDVLRLNHVGDWGTQFGMLIAYLKQQQTDLKQIQKLDLSDLVKAYRLSKIEFEQNPEFKKQAQLEVVSLQQGNQESKAIWQTICAISRTAFEEIYAILDIKLQERGESFYNPLLTEVIADLDAKKLLSISDGAKCVYLEGFTNRDNEPLPLLVQKSDGGYNYATTDMAALRQRVNVEQGIWIIYVTDAGQSQHFSMVFAAARKAGYYDPAVVRIDHVPFGLVLRADGKKFQTRSGDTEKLIDLLQSAINKAQELLFQRNNPDLTAAEIPLMAKTLGLNAIKYADLANNRVSDYTFNLDRMLQFEGNTAAFLSYAYVRVQSIKRKIGLDINQILATQKINLQTPEEIELGLHLLQFPEVINNFLQELMPNRLTDYLYRLAEKFHTFFHHCRVEGVAEQNSRLLLCEAVARILAQGLELLGLKPLQKM
jgi:arginyl-tRNA synthetase